MSSSSEIFNANTIRIVRESCWGFIFKDTRQMARKMRSDYDPKTRLFTNNWKLGIHLLKSI